MIQKLGNKSTKCVRMPRRRWFSDDFVLKICCWDHAGFLAKARPKKRKQQLTLSFEGSRLHYQRIWLVDRNGVNQSDSKLKNVSASLTVKRARNHSTNKENFEMLCLMKFRCRFYEISLEKRTLIFEFAEKSSGREGYAYRARIWRTKSLWWNDLKFLGH